jgi:hypothetical protein
MLLAAVQALAACGDDDGGGSPDAASQPTWQVVHEDLDGALLSVWGTAQDDVWSVGGDPGTGPMVLHWDGSAWDTLDAPSAGDLWWVFGFTGGPVYMGGSGGRILRTDGASFEEMATPSATPIVFGIWGCSPDDVWAVGGNFGGGSGGFAWHLEAGEWVSHDLPDGEVRPVWKVIGRSCDDVRFVGESGLSFTWDGAGFAAETTGVGESLFTDALLDDTYLAVGGLAGIILEDSGSGWQDVSPDGAPGLNGVCAAGGEAFATGQFGAVYRRAEDGSWVEDEMPPTDQTLHACWVDPSGGLWAVGGQVLSPPLVNGVMVYRGDLDFGAGGS